MAWPRITDITPQTIHEIQNILDVAEAASAPGGGSGLGDPGSNGILARTALGVTAARSLTQPAAGLTIANNNGVSGNPTFALANDIAALEALSTTGFARRTATDTWTAAALAAGDIPDLSATYQPLDGDLTAIGAISATSGLLKKTAANTWSLDTNTYATQAYADALVVSLLDDRGNYNASSNVFPSSGGSGAAGAILKGDLWTISVAGTLGGHAVTPGDVVRALVDTPGSTDSNWAIGENNFGYVALNQALADGKIYAGNASGIGTAVTPSGDVTMTNAGVTAIGSGKVTNAMLAGGIDLTAKVVGILPHGNGGTDSAFFSVAGPTALRVYTFPNAAATIARTDAAQTFTGNQTFSGHILPALPDASDVGSALLPFRKGWLSELDAVLFAQNTISVVGGWLLIAKNEGLIPVGQDIASGDTTIDFGQALSTNDFVIFRRAGAVEYVQVGSLSSGTRYNITRDVDGSGANAWPAGSVYVVLGNTGNGRIELNSNATPRISMVTQGATYNAQTELLRTGDLNGGWGYSAETYGFAVGDYSATNITIDSTNGFRIRSGSVNKLVADPSGNLSIVGDLSIGTSGVLRSNASDFLVDAGYWLDYNSGTPRFRIGTTTTLLTRLGSGITPSTPLSVGSGAIANINDNNTSTKVEVIAVNPGTTYFWVLLDLGSAKTVTKVELLQWYEVATVAASGFSIQYSNFPLTSSNQGTAYGATFSASASPQDTSRTGSATARYWGLLRQGNFATDGPGGIPANVGVADFNVYTDAPALATGLAWDGSTLAINNGVMTMSGASASIAIGTTPPTSASAGTGIWLDRTGMYGLSSDAVQVKFDAATGAITAGAGAATLDSSGLWFADGGLGSTSSVRWMNGGVTVGQITADYGSNATEYYLEAVGKDINSLYARLTLSSRNYTAGSAQSVLSLYETGPLATPASKGWAYFTGSGGYLGVRIGDTQMPAAMLDVGGGVVVGLTTPTGGDKGNGTINVSGDLYKNGTAYTNPHGGFEFAYTGKLDKYGDRMAAMGLPNYKPLSLADLESYTRKNFHFPYFADDEDNGMFSGGERLLLITEELAVHLFEMNRRVQQLERMIT